MIFANPSVKLVKIISIIVLNVLTNLWHYLIAFAKMDNFMIEYLFPLYVKIVMKSVVNVIKLQTFALNVQLLMEFKENILDVGIVLMVMIKFIKMNKHYHNVFKKHQYKIL